MQCMVAWLQRVGTAIATGDASVSWPQLRQKKNEAILLAKSKNRSISHQGTSLLVPRQNEATQEPSR